MNFLPRDLCKVTNKILQSEKKKNDTRKKLTTSRIKEKQEKWLISV